MPEENPPQQNLEDLKIRVTAIEDKLRKIFIMEEELKAMNITEEELKTYQKVAAALAQRTSGLDAGRGRPWPGPWPGIIHCCALPWLNPCYVGYHVPHGAIGFGSLGL
jgi:hypothetical protein